MQHNEEFIQPMTQEQFEEVLEVMDVLNWQKHVAGTKGSCILNNAIINRVYDVVDMLQGEVTLLKSMLEENNDKRKVARTITIGR